MCPNCELHIHKVLSPLRVLSPFEFHSTFHMTTEASYSQKTLPSNKAINHKQNAIDSGGIFGLSRYGHPDGPVHLPTDRGMEPVLVIIFDIIQIANRTLRPFEGSLEQILADMGTILRTLGSTRTSRPTTTDADPYTYTRRLSVGPLGRLQ